VRRIVVIHTGAVGDLVQALAALAAVREAHPDASVTFVGRPERGALARLAGAADACIDIETSGLWRVTAPGEASSPCPAWLAEADLVLDFLTKGALGGRAGGPDRVLALRPLPPQYWRAPAATYLAEQVRAALGLPAPRDGEADVPVIPLDAAAIAAGRRVLASHGVAGPFVAIHPGSGSVRKNWPLERFEAIARRVREEAGMPVVWLAGPAEVERGTLPQAAGETTLADLALPEVAAVLAAAAAYLGNDAGVTQVAAAVRGEPGRTTPVVALYGPTDPRVWAPRGAHVRVVRSTDGTMDGIAVEAVWEAIYGVAVSSNA